MALTTKRIIALPPQTEPQEGDYLAIDNAQGGTHKIPVGRIGVELDDTLTEQGKAADAKAVGDALDEIRSQVEATDDAIDEIRLQVEVTGTASGAIATFTDGSDNPMKSCMVTITPKQSGTGTPSPENVRPISGWESVNANVAGKNLSPQTAYEMKLESNVPYIINSNITSPYTTTADYAGAGFAAQVEAGTAYVLSSDVSYGTSTIISWAIYNSLEDATNYANKIESGTTYHTFTPTHSGVLVYMRYHSAAGSTATWTWNQCEFGTTATAYEPYNSDSHTTTTPLGRTVYGGTLDVVSGVLTVTHGIRALDGTEQYADYWNLSTTNRIGVYIDGSRTSEYNTFDCSHYKPTLYGSLSDGGISKAQGGNTTYIIKDSAHCVTDVATYKAYVAEQYTNGTPITVCYELANPQTYQLTPTEVKTLLGENNVWADSGDVEVVYVRDLNIAINNLLNSNGTRSLGMMAMSAPTKDTADEPTDEQTEEPAEDDMR